MPPKMSPIKIHFRPDRKTYYIDIKIDGRRVRESFKTKADAKARAAQIENARFLSGENSLVFDPKEKADYDECRRIMAKAGIAGNVSSILSNLLSQRHGGLVLQSFGAAYDEYLAQKIALQRRDATIHTLRVVVKPFCDSFGTMSMSELTKRDVEHYILKPKWSPRTVKNVFAQLLSFLNFCADRHYLTFEPRFNTKSILPKDPKKPIATYSVEAVADFFAFMERTAYRDLCGYFALQAFCGLRHTEADRISTDDIDFVARTITIPADKAKTVDTWTLRDLPDNLWLWLAKYPQIVPCGDTRRENLVKKWGGNWVRNGFRHTFATMHVALNKSVPATQLILRHRNLNRIWTNYLASNEAHEIAVRYFSIVPATPDSPRLAVCADKAG